MIYVLPLIGASISLLSQIYGHRKEESEKRVPLPSDSKEDECVSWSKTFEESGGAHSVAVTPNEEYVFLGETSLNVEVEGARNLILVKTDKFGNVETTRRPPFQFGTNNFPQGVIVIDPYIIWDEAFVRTDIFGNIKTRWPIILDFGYKDFAEKIRVTRDGGFILASYMYDEEYDEYMDGAVLTKLKPSGEIEWSKIFNSPTVAERFYDVQQTSDGGYIAVGLNNREHYYGADPWVVKTNEFGEVEWERILSRDDCYRGWALSVQQTTDGGYIVANTVEGDFCPDPPGYQWNSVVKLISSGDIEWYTNITDVSIGGEASSIQEVIDGYIFAGSIIKETDRYNYSGWFGKLDFNGNLLWDKRFGEEAYRSGFNAFKVTEDGYVLAGSIFQSDRSYDGWFIKTDFSGEIEREEIFGGEGYDGIYSVEETRDQGFIMGGYTDSFGTGGMWLIKFCPENP